MGIDVEVMYKELGFIFQFHMIMCYDEVSLFKLEGTSIVCVTSLMTS